MAGKTSIPPSHDATETHSLGYFCVHYDFYTKAEDFLQSRGHPSLLEFCDQSPARNSRNIDGRRSRGIRTFRQRESM